MSHHRSKSAVEALAQAAVKEIAEYNVVARRIQRWYRSRIQWRHFSMVLKLRIAKFQATVRAFIIRRRYLTMLERRRPWKDLLRPNEAIVLSCEVVKTSDVKGARNLAKVASAASNSTGASFLKSLLISKKQRQLILTTGEVGSDIAPAPRLFYIDPVTRVWKGEIPFDFALISALTLSEREFIVFSRQNEDKMDKDPIWSFMCGEGSGMVAIDWVHAIRKPMSTTDLVLQPSQPVFLSNIPARQRRPRNRGVLHVNRLRSTSLITSYSNRTYMKGPLLMRQLLGPKKYFQHFFCLKGSTLLWAGPGVVIDQDDSQLAYGITLTANCRIRLLETPRVLPNLPSIAFWLYTPLRSKPLKFRTMDLEAAQKWVEQIGLAIARCEMETSFDRNDIAALAEKVLTQGKALFAERSFLNAKVKFKDALDICYSSSKRGTSTTEIEFECFEYRSRCNFMLGLYERALDDCSQALKLQRLNESCLRTRAACLERLNQLEESLTEYDRVLDMYPTTSSDLKEVRDRVYFSLERLRASAPTISSQKKLRSNAETQATITAMKRPAIARQISDDSLANRSGILLLPQHKSSDSAISNDSTPDAHSKLIPGSEASLSKRRLQFNSEDSSDGNSTAPKRASPPASVPDFRRSSLRSLMNDRDLSLSFPVDSNLKEVIYSPS